MTTPTTPDAAEVARIAAGLTAAQAGALFGVCRFASDEEAENVEIELCEAGVWNLLFGQYHDRLSPFGTAVCAHLLTQVPA